MTETRTPKEEAQPVASRAEIEADIEAEIAKHKAEIAKLETLLAKLETQEAEEKPKARKKACGE